MSDGRFTHYPDGTAAAGELTAGQVIDYSPWGTSHDTALVAGVTADPEPGMVVVTFVAGPGPLRVAEDWPMTLDTPADADLRAVLVMAEAERIGGTP